MGKVKYPDSINLGRSDLESLIEVLKDAEKQNEKIYSFDFDYKRSHLGFSDLALISFTAYSEDDEFDYYRRYKLTGSGCLEYATLLSETKTSNENKK